MLLLKENDLLSDAIVSHPDLIPVLARFGILPGLGSATIKEICSSRGIDITFFLAIVNTFLNEGYLPDREIENFSARSIVDYLRKTHIYYLEVLLPKLELLVENLVLSSGSDAERNRILKKYYLVYVDSLRKHINDEETGIFPYSLEAEDVATGNAAVISQSFSGFTVASFEGEHFNVENAITDLKNIIVRFLKPDYDIHLCHEFLTWLSMFERDIVNHARIEDHILAGKVRFLEMQFKR